MSILSVGVPWRNGQTFHSFCYVGGSDNDFMNEMSQDEFVRLCDEILIPRIEAVIQERLRPLREMVEMLARGLADIHDRFDERGGTH